MIDQTKLVNFYFVKDHFTIAAFEVDLVHHTVKKRSIDIEENFAPIVAPDQRDYASLEQRLVQLMDDPQITNWASLITAIEQHDFLTPTSLPDINVWAINKIDKDRPVFIDFNINDIRVATIKVDLPHKRATDTYIKSENSVGAILTPQEYHYDGLERRMAQFIDDPQLTTLPAMIAAIEQYGSPAVDFQYNLRIFVHN